MHTRKNWNFVLEFYNGKNSSEVPQPHLLCYRYLKLEHPFKIIEHKNIVAVIAKMCKDRHMHAVILGFKQIDSEDWEIMLMVKPA